MDGTHVFRVTDVTDVTPAGRCPDGDTALPAHPSPPLPSPRCPHPARLVGGSCKPIPRRENSPSCLASFAARSPCDGPRRPAAALRVRLFCAVGRGAVGVWVPPRLGRSEPNLSWSRPCPSPVEAPAQSLWGSPQPGLPGPVLPVLAPCPRVSPGPLPSGRPAAGGGHGPFGTATPEGGVPGPHHPSPAHKLHSHAASTQHKRWPRRLKREGLSTSRSRRPRGSLDGCGGPPALPSCALARGACFPPPPAPARPPWSCVLPPPCCPGEESLRVLGVGAPAAGRWAQPRRRRNPGTLQRRIGPSSGQKRRGCHCALVFPGTRNIRVHACGVRVDSIRPERGPEGERPLGWISCL